MAGWAWGQTFGGHINHVVTVQQAGAYKLAQQIFDFAHTSGSGADQTGKSRLSFHVATVHLNGQER